MDRAKTRMKSRREHAVPLPAQAITALEELRPLTYRSADSFVFSAKTKGQLSLQKIPWEWRCTDWVWCSPWFSIADHGLLIRKSKLERWGDWKQLTIGEKPSKEGLLAHWFLGRACRNDDSANWCDKQLLESDKEPNWGDGDPHEHKNTMPYPFNKEPVFRKRHY